MLDQVKIELSLPDKSGKCRVKAKYRAQEYPDNFDPASDYHRRTFAQNVLAMFGWEETPEHIDGVIAALLKELARVEQTPGERVDARPVSDLESNEMSWLWPGRIALGKLCVIAGDPGLGKSLLSLDITAHATRGAPWPDECGFAPVTSVFLMSTEDDYSSTIRPRLEAAGADLERVVAVFGMTSGTGSAKTQRMLDFVTDLDKLRATIEERAEPRLLVIDPIASFLGTTSENVNAEVRQLLTPLSALADQTNTAILMVSHLRKSVGSNLHRIIGSIAFAAIARSAFVVQRVKGGVGNERRLVPVKSNLGGTRTAIRFRVEKHPDCDQPHVVWGELESHEGVELPDSEPGRPEQLSSELRDCIDATLAAGPLTMAELRGAGRAGAAAGDALSADHQALPMAG